MKNRVLGSLTFEEISRLRERSVLVLPIGSMEQHGPHLPLDTDAVLAERLASAIATRFGDAFDLWQLPLLPLGLSREHAWTAGTLSLSVSGITVLLRELAGEIARSLPARNLMIVNGHGGNRGILEDRSVNESHPVRVQIHQTGDVLRIPPILEQPLLLRRKRLACALLFPRLLRDGERAVLRIGFKESPRARQQCRARRRQRQTRGGDRRRCENHR